MTDSGIPPSRSNTTPKSDAKHANLTYVREHVHSVMMDLAFRGVKERPYMKLALCVALYLVLALIWVPGFRFEQVVDATKVASAPTARRKIMKPPPEKIRKTTTKKAKARKVPMPDSTPMDPEPVVEPLPLAEPDLVATDDWEIGEWPEVVGTGAGESTAGNIHIPGEDGLTPPHFTRRVSPKYPDEAVKIKLQGYVILEAILRKNGDIDQIEVVRGLSSGKFGFEREAAAALRKWEFLPGKLEGVPVDVRMTIKIDFILY